VHCLKELRTLEASGETPAKFKDYVPENLEVRALLSRDKNMRDDLYKAAVADTLIITMKVQFCHIYVLLRQVAAATSYRCGHRTPGIDYSHCSIRFGHLQHDGSTRRGFVLVPLHTFADEGPLAAVAQGISAGMQNTG